MRRLEVERTIICAASGDQHSPSITFPPALDLPNSLATPDTLPRTLSIPQCYRCPLGSGVMAAPVVTPAGLSYERCARHAVMQLQHAPIRLANTLDVV